MFTIGTYEAKHGLVLAPLAGITESIFRGMCRSYGAEVVFSEMVSAEGIRRKTKRTLSYVHFIDTERPVVLQIFGSRAESLCEAAQILEQEYHPDIIDINLGCPVRKVTKTGAGAALLQDLRKLAVTVSPVVAAVKTPVSAKIRLGWNENRSAEIVQVLSDCGVSLLTVHARTAKQGFGTRADWGALIPIRTKASIPLIANGDIACPRDAAFLLNELGMDGVMVGRGAIGRPWIFSHMREYLEKGTSPAAPGPGDQLRILLEHMGLMEQQWGSQRAAGRIKKHIPYYLKGMDGSKRHVQNLLSRKTFDEIRSEILNISAQLK